MRLLWMGIVIGCVFGGVVGYLLHADRAPAPTPRLAPPLVKSEAQAAAKPEIPAAPSVEFPAAEIFERLDRLDRSLESVRASVASLAAGIARHSKPIAAQPEVPKETDASTPVTAAPPKPPAADEEKEDLTSISNDVLLGQVKAVTRTHGGAMDVDGALRRVQALLDRALSPDERADAYVEEGILFRMKKDSAHEEEAFRRAMTEQDLTTPRGQEAAFQLGWTLSERSPRDAIEMFDVVAKEPATPSGFRQTCRWEVIRNAELMGDRARLRLELESFVADYGQLNAGWIADRVRDARDKLAALRRSRDRVSPVGLSRARERSSG